MAPSLFTLLDVSRRSKDKVDGSAVIKEAQQNPKDLDCIFDFGFLCQGCPLHQAIQLELGTDVITPLIIPFAIRHKDQFGFTALHWICCHERASLAMVHTIADE
eukprot:4659486-Ditylum_brightwellii.AAC.1